MMFQMLIFYTNVCMFFVVASIVPWVFLQVYTIGTRVNRAAHMTMQKHDHLNQPGTARAVYHSGDTNHTTSCQGIVYSNNKTKQQDTDVFCCIVLCVCCPFKQHRHTVGKTHRQTQRHARVFQES